MGMNPVELERQIDQIVDCVPQYARLSSEGKIEFRQKMGSQLEMMAQMLDDERTKTIGYVLQIMDQLDRIEKSPMLRRAIIAFRDGKSPENIFSGL
jgi:hypothetical protein